MLASNQVSQPDTMDAILNKLNNIYTYVLKSTPMDRNGNAHTPKFLLNLSEEPIDNLPVYFLHPSSTKETLDYLKSNGLVNVEDLMHTKIGTVTKLYLGETVDLVVFTEIKFDFDNYIVKWLDSKGFLKSFGVSTEILTSGIIQYGRFADGLEKGTLIGIALVPIPADYASGFVQKSDSDIESVYRIEGDYTIIETIETLLANGNISLAKTWGMRLLNVPNKLEVFNLLGQIYTKEQNGVQMSSVTTTETKTKIIEQKEEVIIQPQENMPESVSILDKHKENIEHNTAKKDNFMTVKIPKKYLLPEDYKKLDK